MRGFAKAFMLTCVATGCAALAAAAVASEELPDPMDLGVPYQKFAFEAADTNGDDLISEGEFARDAAAAFAGLDSDHNMKLTPQELGPHAAERFRPVDASGDGMLTFDEVMKFKMKAFRAADKNNDDALSYDEMVDAVRKELGQ
jgi:Ca2+-binding EF-hand superfamily protein